MTYMVSLLLVVVWDASRSCDVSVMTCIYDAGTLSSVNLQLAWHLTVLGHQQAHWWLQIQIYFFEISMHIKSVMYQKWNQSSHSMALNMISNFFRGLFQICGNGLDIDGLVQEIRSSGALAVELRLSCTNPSIWWCRYGMKWVKEPHLFHLNTWWNSQGTKSRVCRYLVKPGSHCGSKHLRLLGINILSDARFHEITSTISGDVISSRGSCEKYYVWQERLGI